MPLMASSPIRTHWNLPTGTSCLPAQPLRYLLAQAVTATSKSNSLADSSKLRIKIGPKPWHLYMSPWGHYRQQSRRLRCLKPAWRFPECQNLTQEDYSAALSDAAKN